jgi:hypothetical protein
MLTLGPVSGRRKPAFRDRDAFDRDGIWCENCRQSLEIGVILFRAVFASRIIFIRRAKAKKTKKMAMKQETVAGKGKDRR